MEPGLFVKRSSSPLAITLSLDSLRRPRGECASRSCGGRPEPAGIRFWPAVRLRRNRSQTTAIIADGNREVKHSVSMTADREDGGGERWKSSSRDREALLERERERWFEMEAPPLGRSLERRLALATPGRETRGRPTTPSEPRLTLRRCARGALSSGQLPVQSAMSWPR